ALHRPDHREPGSQAVPRRTRDPDRAEGRGRGRTQPPHLEGLARRSLQRPSPRTDDDRPRQAETMNDFRTKLLQATRETASTRSPWDDVLNDFVAVLNERYADALRAYLLGSAASGEVELMVVPLGWRSQRTTLLALAFDETGARTLDEKNRTFTTPDA